MTENLIVKTRKKMLSETTIDVADYLYKNIINFLDSYVDSENNFYIKAIESIEDNPNQLKAFLFLALKENFTCTELDLLTQSSTDSRNYLIAYNKLGKFYRRTLTQSDLQSNHMTYNEMVAIIFEQMSQNYVEMVDPNAKNAKTDKEKLMLKDYNAISEMFIK